MSLKTYWCGWAFPIPLLSSNEIAEKWPDGVQGWCSGETFGAVSELRIYVGAVEAEDPRAAEVLVLSMYGTLAEHVRWRWEPEEMPKEWTGPGDRFPGWRPPVRTREAISPDAPSHQPLPTIQCAVCDAKLHTDGSTVDFKGSGFCKRCGTPTYRLVCNECLPHVVAGWEALHAAAPKRTAADKLD